MWLFGGDRMEPKSKSDTLVSVIYDLVTFGCTRTRAEIKAFFRVLNAFLYLRSIGKLERLIRGWVIVENAWMNC